MDPAIVIAAISLAGSVTGGFLLYLRDRKNSGIEERKVDQVAYDKAMAYMEKQLDRMTAQNDRLEAQLNRVLTQLASEQDVSNTLRNQIQTMQGQIAAQSAIIRELRDQLDSLRENGRAVERPRTNV